MSKVKNELEELSFRYLEPEAYEALQGARRARAARRPRGSIEELRRTIIAQARRRRRCRSSRSTAASSASTASTRSCKRQKIDLDQVYDFVALRIVTQVGEGLLRGARHHPPDLVAGARPHQGLHRDAAAERLPVAAHLGHQRAAASRSRCRSAPRRCTGRAEEGIAAHWKYKEGRVGAERDERYFQWLRQLLEWQQEVRDPQEFIQNLKIDLYPEEVYTFTPQGPGEGAAARRDAGRLRLRDPHRRRPPVRRRARQRQDGAAAHAAQERRHRRDRHAGRATSRAATG